MSYEAIKFIHVLLLVFWLGTDVGVLLLARKFRDSGLSVETRLTLLQMAMVIDTLPRICFIVMLPAGCTPCQCRRITQYRNAGLWSVCGCSPQFC